MERELLFRGKTANGEWVYGGVLKTQDYVAICTPTAKPGWRTFIEVIPETVGQFTGLYDGTKWEQLAEEEKTEWLLKHPVYEWKGKPIFEGDIVRHYTERGMKEGNPDVYEVGLIRWNGKFLSWERTTPSRRFPYDFVRLGINCAYEVIGNIHDNPELVKEEDSNG